MFNSVVLLCVVCLILWVLRLTCGFVCCWLFAFFAIDFGVFDFMPPCEFVLTDTFWDTVQYIS